MPRDTVGCRHTSRILVIWVTILPFTLWDQCRWLTTPAAAVIAFLLLGIEEIGVSIEEPCSILALGACPAARRHPCPASAAGPVPCTALSSMCMHSMHRQEPAQTW